MTESIAQPVVVIDFSIDPVGKAFIPSAPHSDFPHGDFLFIGCSPPYSVVNWGWTPRGTASKAGSSVRFNLVIGCNPTYSYIDFGPVPHGSAITSRADTHDGVYAKKKKKKKPTDRFAEELERRDRIKKQIDQVIHPTVVEVVPVEEKEEEVARSVIPVEIKSLETPAIDYAGLARQQIVARIQDDAQRELQRQLELKRQEDEEEERELMMILDDIL